MTHYYNPTTKEQIKNPKVVRDWFGTTELEPPQNLSNDESAMFVDGEWVVKGRDVQAELDEWRQNAKVSRRQAKQALIIHGIYDQVQSVIDSIPDEQERKILEVFWQDSNTFERLHPQLISLTEELNMNPEEVDSLFELAQTL